jgi:hypothetical protein
MVACRLPLVLASALLAALLGAPLPALAKSAASMTEAAQNLLAALGPDQKAKAVIAFEAPERLDFHFIPKARKGLPLKEMTPAQRHLAYGFIAAGLSQRGYLKATTIMSLEEILAELEQGRSTMVRDAELYYLTLFGTPAEGATWGWSLEGHHLSLNFTVVGGQMVATTPAFMGTNPAEVRQGPRTGLRVLAREEDLARELVTALDARQRAAAIIEEKAPNDIVTGAKQRVDPLDPKGITVKQMSRAQRQMLIGLLEEYAFSMPADIAEERLEKIRKAGLDKVVFAWAGPIDKGQAHYYRVQGPTFLIEYDNTQNNANHVHAIWRDFKGDFGSDLLAEHYKNAEHHQKP